MEQIYVLQCEKGKYYVGKTSDIDRRFAEHLSGEGGSEWTRYYRAQQIIEVETMNSPFDEMKKTLEYMERFGIDNVRGAQWSNIELTSHQRDEIMIAINPNACFHCGELGHYANNCNRRNQPSSARTGQCFTCGQYGHFANECNHSINHCERCGRESHSEEGCYATRDINGGRLNCARCGRDSHSANQCYAKTDINGRWLH